MRIEPHYDDAARPEHIARTFVDETARIIDDLDARREVLRDLWSLHRDRGPFIDSVSETWQQMPANDLLLLDGDLFILVQAFYRTLGDFRLYVAYTKDMPTTLIGRYDRTLERLRAIAEAIVDTSGLQPTRPLLDQLNLDPEVLKFFTPTWPETPEADLDAPQIEPEEILITGEER
jgi:hypothetical protein